MSVVVSGGEEDEVTVGEVAMMVRDTSHLLSDVVFDAKQPDGTQA